MTFIYPTAFETWRHGDGGPESAAIDRVLRSGRYTIGAEVEAFEAELAAYHGRRHAICCNSGSSANLLALSAVANYIEPTRRISLPAIAWATTYAPFVQLGYGKQIVISDVDDSWNAVHKNENTHNIICPVLGNPTSITNMTLLEDGCESAGARAENGRLCGGPGPIASTGSGFWSHQISCIEMGWVLTDDDRIAEKVKLLRNHGNVGWNSKKWEERYDFVAFGYNLRPLEMHAAIGREQLRKLDAGNEQRRLNRELFLAECLARKLPVQFPRITGISAPFSIAFEVEASSEVRSKLVYELQKNAIDSRLPTGGSFTCHQMGAPWRTSNPTPRADLVHYRGMFLGNAPFDISSLIEKAVIIMRKVL